MVGPSSKGGTMTSPYSSYCTSAAGASASSRGRARENWPRRPDEPAPAGASPPWTWHRRPRPQRRRRPQSRRHWTRRRWRRSRRRRRARTPPPWHCCSTLLLSPPPPHADAWPKCRDRAACVEDRVDDQVTFGCCGARSIGMGAWRAGALRKGETRGRAHCQTMGNGRRGRTFLGIAGAGGGSPCPRPKGRSGRAPPPRRPPPPPRPTLRVAAAPAGRLSRSRRRRVRVDAAAGSNDGGGVVHAHPGAHPPPTKEPRRRGRPPRGSANARSQLGGEQSSLPRRRARVLKTGSSAVVSHQANGWISVQPDGGGDHVARARDRGLGSCAMKGRLHRFEDADCRDRGGSGARGRASKVPPRAPPLKGRVAAKVAPTTLIGRHVRPALEAASSAPSLRQRARLDLGEPRRRRPPRSKVTARQPRVSTWDPPPHCHRPTADCDRDAFCLSRPRSARLRGVTCRFTTV